MSNNKTLSKLEQIKLAAAAQSNKNIAQANVKESRLKVSDIKLNPNTLKIIYQNESLCRRTTQNPRAHLHALQKRQRI